MCVNTCFFEYVFDCRFKTDSAYIAHGALQIPIVGLIPKLEIPFFLAVNSGDAKVLCGSA